MFFATKARPILETIPKAPILKFYHMFFVYHFSEHELIININNYYLWVLLHIVTHLNLLNCNMHNTKTVLSPYTYAHRTRVHKTGTYHNDLHTHTSVENNERSASNPYSKMCCWKHEKTKNELEATREPRAELSTVAYMGLPERGSLS